MIVIEKKNVADAWNPKAKPTCSVRLTPVHGDENKTWSAYTPSGSIELQINNPDAYEAFELGKTYFVDFTSAPLAEADESK
jgi:hypothetical protein